MPKELTNLNVVIIGHVDSGKSTTCGQLCAKYSKIDERVLEKYQKEAQELGKSSFSLAFVMDKLKEERERGITISASLTELFMPTRKITIIDAPGHRDFIKNMITGASQADAAILVVSSAVGEYEAGIGPVGQTKEHVLLAQTLGIKNFIIAVNKVDTKDKNGKAFSQERFDEIKNDMTAFFEGLGYKKDRFQFIPVSGFHGDNVCEKSKNTSWYTGVPLAKAMEELPEPKRPFNKPLRVPINAVYKVTGIGTVAAGRVETGVVKVGMPCVMQPGGKVSEVKSIESHFVSMNEAGPGISVGMNLRNVPRDQVKRGMVLGDTKDTPPKECEEFVARLIIVNHRGQIKTGYSPTLHVHAANVACELTKIEEVFDRRTSKPLSEQTFLKMHNGASVTFKPKKPLVVERFKKFSQLGRFSIRDSKITVGVGVIKDVVFKESANKK